MLNFPTVERITTKEAAEIIGLDEHVIREYCRRKTIPAEKFGRQWAILRADAEAYRDKINAENAEKGAD